MLSSLLNALAPGAKLPRWATALVLLGLAALGGWYVRAALAHGVQVNASLQAAMDREVAAVYGGDSAKAASEGRPVNAFDLNDQRVYMNYAKGMKESGYSQFITRMRMPMFMWLLSTTADATPRSPEPEKLRQFYADFFPVARAFNVGLSLALLVAMFFGVRRWVGNWIGLCFCLVTGFQLFILKSPYVQPEVLLSAVVAVTLAWILRTLHEPTWKNAVMAGLLLCVWHMTKANALVALGLTGAVMGGQVLFASWKRRRAILIAGPVLLAAYLLPMSPYLYHSYQVFGNPFYNVQSKYYMWAEDVDDKHGLQDMGLDRSLESVDLDGDRKVDNPDALPSAGKYWREHSWDEIERRVKRGIIMMFRGAFTEYPPLFTVLLLWSGFLLAAMAINWERASRALIDWKWEILYLVILLTAFTFLFGWFTTLRVGPRLVTSVILGPLLFVMAGVHALLGDQVVRFRGAAISAEKLLVVLFLLAWAGFTVFHLPGDLITGYFAG